MYVPYCVFKQEFSKGKTKKIMGINNQPVKLFCQNGLSIAVSHIESEKLEVNIKAITLFRDVVSFYSNSIAIIPMRYGGFFRTENDILQHLTDKSVFYKSMLKEIDGCVEMSIRVYLENNNADKLNKVTNENNITDNSIKYENKVKSINKEDNSQNINSKISGKSFLQNRKKHYEAQDNKSTFKNDEIDKLVTSFNGLYLKHKIEIGMRVLKSMINSKEHNNIVSIYFLVHRNNVNKFSKSFIEVSSKYKYKILLSGPWAPFNFVS